MSRSDILKRAMLATTTPEVPADPAKAEPPAQAPARVSTTGPGAMMNFMVQRSEVHKELELAKQRLAEVEGGQVAKAIDPKLVNATAYANRMEPAFKTAAFVALKDEIAAAGGNVVPIKVRRIAREKGADATFEIVYGHRRHRACLELGLPVTALVVDALSDQDLFIEMERENRGREDLSAWEQGLHYARALDTGLFPSLRQMATALGVQASNASNALSIARLPDAVLAAFASPLDVQFRWASPLRDAHQRDPDGLIARAKTIAALSKRPAAADIFRQLTNPKATAAAPNGREWVDGAGKSQAKLELDSKGRVRLSIYKVLAPAELKKLESAIDSLLG